MEPSTETVLDYLIREVEKRVRLEDKLEALEERRKYEQRQAMMEKARMEVG